VDGISHIFRWDLDKTYLKTDFDTVRDLVRVARMSAEERENIPGSAALLREMRTGAMGSDKNLIYFISGSPRQLRTVIEKKFALDGFVPDGFVLKPSFSMLMRGRIRGIRNQVPYKLSALLSGRGDSPIGTLETLLGDDAESDALIYSLYGDILSGLIDRDFLLKFLKKTKAYKDQLEAIEHQLDAIVHEETVKRIIINLDRNTAPAEFFDYFPRVVPVHNHLQTAIVLCLDQTVSLNAVRDVAYEMLWKFGYKPDTLLHSAEDIFRRQRAYQPQKCYERMLEELSHLEPPKPPSRANKRASDNLETTMNLMRQLKERLEYLQTRPLPRNTSRVAPHRDYFELLVAEEKRREARKKVQNAGR
jgi:hypothetical protein